MRLLRFVLIALLALVAPARAEIAWTDLAGGYEPKAAELFKLRAELPPELNENLKSIRNGAFADEAAFRAALAGELLNDALRQEWTDRLVGLARSGGGAFGVEAREGDLLTLTRESGDSLRPETVIWMRAKPVTSVQIDGRVAPFTQEEGSVTVPINTLNISLKIELE